MANPAVTQANIAQTICVPGWWRTIAPPPSYTDQIKRAQLVAYGFVAPLDAFQEDHLIPLTLGGHPTDPRNLWPEPGYSPTLKRQVEALVWGEVCADRMSLAVAQQRMARDWTTASGP